MYASPPDFRGIENVEPCAVYSGVPIEDYTLIRSDLSADRRSIVRVYRNYVYRDDCR